MMFSHRLGDGLRGAILRMKKKGYSDHQQCSRRDEFPKPSLNRFGPDRYLSRSGNNQQRCHENMLALLRVIDNKVPTDSDLIETALEENVCRQKYASHNYQ